MGSWGAKTRDGGKWDKQWSEHRKQKLWASEQEELDNVVGTSSSEVTRRAPCPNHC